MKSPNAFFVLVILLFTSFASSCSSDDKDDVTFNKVNFDQELSHWNTLDLKNYTFSYNYFSSSSGPVTCKVIIHNGVLESAVNNINTQSDVPFQSISDIYKSVDGIYQSLLADDIPSYANSVAINCTYNNEYHYPMKVGYLIDYKEDVLGGGYYRFEMTNFELLD